MKPPIIQLNKGRKSGSLRIMRPLVMAVAKDPIATPAKINVGRPVPVDFLAIKYAMDTELIPPTKEATGRKLKFPVAKGIPDRKTMVAPRAAPDATPIK